ncbi:MAG: RdgB/HAM1 family non-canonical purine NTP pyrophosphatase [Kiritimatiellae bacterium]|nr:RdgB/HAM1 family non-canonical purine NTP pyrophosphatase [Kiritimatiellia bacterium]
MKLFVATHNQHKIREISQILPDFEIVPDDPEGVEENAPDFAGNALIKVHAIAARHPGEWCMADDSGLEVRALGGAPGVHSARYAGEPCSTSANNALLLKNLEGKSDRRARFTCCCALVDPSGEEMVVHGHCPGRIAEKASGSEGFGYDPLFIPDGYDKSFADLSADEKNAISHRGRALEKVKAIVGDGSAVDGSRAEHAERVEGKCGSRVLAWLRLFRVVNLPTVPGDVLVGAASVLCWGADAAISSRYAQVIAAASLASVFLYMFGLVDNDIVGAKGDRGRPIPDGEISIGAARIARGLCLFAALIVGAAANLQSDWWIASFLLAMSVVVYNRTKLSLFMGLCRGLNVLSGAVVVGMCGIELAALALVAPLVWTLYITVVTWYSTGEENDPDKKRRVGLLVGGIVYLQLAVLIYLTMKGASVMPLLVTGAVLLVVLRLMKRLLPRVSAS